MSRILTYLTSSKLYAALILNKHICIVTFQTIELCDIYRSSHKVIHTIVHRLFIFDIAKETIFWATCCCLHVALCYMLICIKHIQYNMCLYIISICTSKINNSNAVNTIPSMGSKLLAVSKLFKFSYHRWYQLHSFWYWFVSYIVSDLLHAEEMWGLKRNYVMIHLVLIFCSCILGHTMYWSNATQV